MKQVAIAVILIALSRTAQAQPTPDDIARNLGEMEWRASVCRVPTAPLEAALDGYIQRIQAGALQAHHLRDEMLAGRTEYERMFGTHMNCENAAAKVAALIAKTNQYGLR